MRLRDGLFAMLVAMAVLAGSIHVSAQQQAPSYYGIQPGESTRAQVELRYGDPIGRIGQNAATYEYAPPAADADSARLVITFDEETQQVGRLDAYLKVPLPSSVFRDQFGPRIAARDRSDGGREEFYYPQLQALVFGDKSPDALVIAVSFVSPRTLGWVFVRRFEEALNRKAFEDARTEADKAVAVDPEGGEGYYAQGRLFTALGDADEAIVRFTAALNAKCKPSDRVQVHIWLGSIYANLKKMPDNADTEYRKAIRIAPNAATGNAHFQYSHFLKAQGKNQEALAELVKAVEADAANVEARSALAEAYWEKADYATALPHYEVLSGAADVTPGDARNVLAHYRYGVALRKAGRTAEAITAYEKALRLNPNDIKALNNLALIHVKDGGNPAKGIELYR